MPHDPLKSQDLHELLTAVTVLDTMRVGDSDPVSVALTDAMASVLTIESQLRTGGTAAGLHDELHDRIVGIARAIILLDESERTGEPAGRDDSRPPASLASVGIGQDGPTYRPGPPARDPAGDGVVVEEIRGQAFAVNHGVDVPLGSPRFRMRSAPGSPVLVGVYRDGERVATIAADSDGFQVVLTSLAELKPDTAATFAQAVRIVDDHEHR